MNISPEQLAMMKVQGQLRIKFIGMGINSEKAHDLAAEALHVFLTSNLSDYKIRKVYKETLPDREMTKENIV